MTALKALIWAAAVATMIGFGQETAKKISTDEALRVVVSKVQPEYPQTARQFKIEGKVDLQALVDENGSVESVRAVSGNPILAKPSSEALKKWKFKPFSDSGKTNGQSTRAEMSTRVGC